MKWYEFMVANWPQVSVLLAIVLGSIGFIIKSILGYRYKTREIAFNYFTNEKLNAAKFFLKEYSGLVLFIAQIYNASTLFEKTKSGELEKIDLELKLENFTHAYAQLLLFFPEEKVKECMDIYKNIHEVIDKYFDDAQEYAKRSIEFSLAVNSRNFMMQVIAKNNQLISTFSKNMREEFLKIW